MSHLKNAVFFSLLLFLMSCRTTQPASTIPDGLYLISKVDTIETQLSPLAENEAAVSFSKLFDEYNEEGFMRIIIDKTEYVPLDLEKEPESQQQTEAKKNLLLSLTNLASEKLIAFTTKHVMARVVLVVDGEALTMHKIREPLTSGKLQITRCNDNACERLLVKLKDNVK